MGLKYESGTGIITATLAIPSARAATTAALPHRPTLDPAANRPPSPPSSARTPNAGRNSRTPSCPGVCGIARSISRNTQWPAISRPIGSLRRRANAAHQPQQAHDQEANGVTSTVQTSVLYQGSDSSGVS